MDKRPAKQESFIVRFWREESQSGWRGWVQHTRSGEVAVVRSVDELVAFFEARFGKLQGGGARGLK
jgi:hypothetical protein